MLFLKKYKTKGHVSIVFAIEKNELSFIIFLKPGILILCSHVFHVFFLIKAFLHNALVQHVNSTFFFSRDASSDR